MWVPASSVFLGLTAASLLTLRYIRWRGVVPRGDEPSYLVGGYAISHLHTWNLAGAMQTPFAYSVNGSVSQLGEFITRHGVDFATHPIGFSAVLAVPIFFSATLVAANVGLIVILSALGAWIGWEISNLVPTTRRSVALVALLFVTPAYLLASTQFYPDLLSGMMLAVIALRLVRMEVSEVGRWPSTLVTGLLLSAWTWVDTKNILVAILFATAGLLILRRRGATTSLAATLLAPVAVALITVCAFNLYAYGHPLGLDQGLRPFTVSAATKVLALLIDRRHGLIVQCPAVVLGIYCVGSWLRRAPVSLGATFLTSLILLGGNASVVTGMSGASFIGRYEWEVLPVLLAFAGIFLVRLGANRIRAAASLIVVIGAFTAFEIGSVVTNRPTPFSFISNNWDPASYLGWWGRLDPSPILNYLNHEWGNARNVWGVACLVLLIAAALAGLYLLEHRARRGARTLLALLIVAAASAWVVELRSPFLLPFPVTYAASDLGPFPLPVPAGDITVTGPSSRGTIMSGPNYPVIPGRYEVTITYRLADEKRNVAVARATLKVASRTTTLRTAALTSGPEHREALIVTVRQPGALSLNVAWHGSGTLDVSTVEIAKIASCNVVNCQGGIL